MDKNDIEDAVKQSVYLLIGHPDLRIPNTRGHNYLVPLLTDTVSASRWFREQRHLSERTDIDYTSQSIKQVIFEGTGAPDIYNADITLSENIIGRLCNDR